MAPLYYLYFLELEKMGGVESSAARKAGRAGKLF